MKRPLFWVCFALSCLAILNFSMMRGRGMYDTKPVWADAEGNVICTGQVTAKEEGEDRDYFYLQLNGVENPEESPPQSGLISETALYKAATNHSDITNQKNSTSNDSSTNDFSSKDLSADSVENTKNDSERKQQNSRVSGCLRCSVEKDAIFMPKIGSFVTVTGRAGQYSEAKNPGEFDQRMYFLSKGVDGWLKVRNVEIRKEGYSHILEDLYRIRKYFSKRLDRVYPAKEAGIMKAILLGERGSLDDEIRELYRDGGMLHILSISGLHITLIGTFCSELLRRLGAGKRLSAAVGAILLVIYGMMTGMNISACRAIGMYLIRTMGRMLGRTYDALTALGVVAAAILCVQPYRMLNSGFWLSFGCVSGVICVLPVLEEIPEILRREGASARGTVRRRGLRKPVSGGVWQRLTGRMAAGIRGGVSISLISLPLQLYFYFEYPLWSIPVNLLVLPLMGLLVGCGFLAMLIPGLGILGTVDVLLLRLFEASCILVRNLPGKTWNPGKPMIWQILLYYLLLMVALAGAKMLAGKPTRMIAGLWKKCLLFLFILCPITIFLLPVHRMEGIVALSVGQGDCILLRERDHSVWIFDCGSSDQEKVAENILIPYLKEEGIRRIEGIFISHGDMDHIGGIAEFLNGAAEEGFSVGEVYIPRLSEDRIRHEFGELGENLSKTVTLVAGDGIRKKDLLFEVLHPTPDSQRKDGNEDSLCVYVTMRGMTALFTGDVSGDGERGLVQALKERGIDQVTLLKCAHHGSRNSTTQEFLDALVPEYAVISCGQNNRYGHPHAETLERLKEKGVKVLRTDELGAIILNISPSGQLQ